MKKLLILLGLASVILVACTEDTEESNTSNNDAHEEEKDVSKENNLTSNNNSDNDDSTNNKANQQQEDKTLNKVGDTIYDPEIQGEVELLSINEPNETIELDPVIMTIKDIKVLKLSDVKNQGILDFIEYHGGGNSISYVQIRYKIENTKNVEVRLNSSIKSIILNEEEQIDSFDNDIMQDENFARTLYGKMEDKSGIGIVIKDTNPEDIENIKVVTGRIDGKNSKTIAEPQTLSYDMD